MKFVFLTISIALFLTESAYGHGRMENPPARNAAWRHGFNTPANYDDVGLNCGGGAQPLDGKNCGVCGDSARSTNRPHEVGGQYATGTIVKTYSVGQTINVDIYLSANHLGYFEFRLCPVNNPKIEATHECLNRNLLKIEGHGTRYAVSTGESKISLRIKLPDGLSCSQCVLQWKYRGGNNWGTENGQSGLGIGSQEEFYNCADIAIGSNAPTVYTQAPTISSTTKYSTTQSFYTTPPSPSITTKTTTTTFAPINIDWYAPENIFCIPAPEWLKVPEMIKFCEKICTNRNSTCPTKYCQCHGINANLLD